MSRENPNFRRQPLTSLQKDFKLGLLEEEKRRSLGNIRFIGKLYKLQLMTARIMHECMKKLLGATSPLALEKLVKLLHIAGPSLRAEDQGLSELTSPLKKVVAALPHAELP